MLDRIQKHINQSLSFLKESKLLIAISGGVDSVVLTDLCHKLHLDISLAHCNFMLRGTESDADEQFVLDLGNSLGLEVFVVQFETEKYAKSQKLSIQMAARELRYKWFSDMSERLGFDYVLTAHHADDNLETVLINFIRGTGLNGLTGIPAVQGKFVRPLLPFKRHDIELYAMNNDIKWIEDGSNASRKYLRNKLRHDVIPMLKEINPQLLDSFQNTISNLSDTADLVEDNINSFTMQAVEQQHGNELRFRIAAFQDLKNPKAYLFELLKDYGFTEWNDVLNLLDAQSGKQVFSETHCLLKHREYLILTDLNNLDTIAEQYIISDSSESIQFALGDLSITEVQSFNQGMDTEIFVDEDKLQFPLTIRKWKHGDVFQPLGMSGKKKISKYLKDEKLSRFEKEKIWLLISGSSDVIWVIGKRADDRFKITDQTRQILKIKLSVTSNEHE